MKFTVFLKGQLFDFIDSYIQYGKKTFTTTLAFTVLCFLAITLLLYFNTAPPLNDLKQISLQDFFWTRFSTKEIYCIVDLSKIVFIFFVSLFSIGLTRLTIFPFEEPTKLSFSNFIIKLKLIDILLTFFVLILCCFIDFGLSRLKYISLSNAIYPEFDKWYHSILFFLRIYIPMILFSITVFKLSSKNPLKLSIKKIVFLLISLWLFNEFAYEFNILIKHNVLGLILIPIDNNSRFLYESLLEILLVAFYFVGFNSAMTSTFKQFEKQ
jgi:hypothetical protein